MAAGEEWSREEAICMIYVVNSGLPDHYRLLLYHCSFDTTRGLVLEPVHNRDAKAQADVPRTQEVKEHRKLARWKSPEGLTMNDLNKPLLQLPLSAPDVDHFILEPKPVTLALAKLEGANLKHQIYIRIASWQAHYCSCNSQSVV
jgi:hypothetical protein